MVIGVLAGLRDPVILLLTSIGGSGYLALPAIGWLKSGFEQMAQTHFGG
jgi:hypothetical protein